MVVTLRSLGIDIPAELATKQAAWFAPEQQPFLVSEAFAKSIQIAPIKEPLSPESRDTFEIYGIQKGTVCISLDEDLFQSLEQEMRVQLLRSQLRIRPETVPAVKSAPPSVREKARKQADGHRFFWWPSLLKGHESEVIGRYLEHGRRASRHQEITDSHWRDIEAVLPGAKALAGSFPAASGPNCFGTVMGASGVPQAADTWVVREPFEEWLTTSTTSSANNNGKDGELGTILVWRSRDGLVQHAAITLGRGYVLHKPSQGWMSPRKILTVREAMLSTRQPGLRIHRYSLRF